MIDIINGTHVSMIVLTGIVITFCGKVNNSKQRFPIQMDIACGNSCLIISATTVAKQAVNQDSGLFG